MNSNNQDKAMDLCAFGEILIDFTEGGQDEQGHSLFVRYPGGAPGNVCVGAARLGKRTAFIGKAGEDMHGQFLKDVLNREAVNTDNLVLDPDTFTTLAFVSVNDQGERTFSFARKPGADTQMRFEEVDPDLLASTKIFHVGSLSLTHEPARTTTFQSVKQAKEHGALISYDPNYRASLWPSEEKAIEGMRSLIEQADIMKISDEETALLTGYADPAQAAKALIEQGVQVAAVTLGAEGVLVANQEGALIVPGFKSKVADTNGAGDSFWAAFLTRIAESGRQPRDLCLEELREFARFANGVAALTVRKPGAIPAMPTRGELEEFLMNNH